MTEKELIQKCESGEIGFVRLQITDINGMLKNVEVPARMLPTILEKGAMFDGSSIDGFVRIEESDMYLRPDLSTFAFLPWDNCQGKTIRLICDVYKPDGTPFEGDPRYVLKRVIQRAKSMGFETYAGPEPEFFIVKRDHDRGKPIGAFLDTGSYFDLLPVDGGEEVRKQIVLSLQEMGFEVEAAHHEVAPSQHEIDFRYTDILKTADNIQTFKWVVKTIAIADGFHATFMPKPFSGVNGSGMHIHMSLFSDGNNAFYDSSKDHGLSQTALSFVGGIISHAKEITAVTNPTINSYKRLTPGYEAPVNISWALGNRSAMIRIPSTRGEGTRLEFRSPDPTCNPYLALALTLAAGLDGVEKRIDPPNPVDESIFKMKGSRRKELMIENLPGTLINALEFTRNSEFVRSTLGDHIFNTFVRSKEGEWSEFCASVTDWEISKYLELY
ncbi:type I glutamate--ammonia ligase [Mesotoga prima]|uniref:type I glutamate--ammonia ligase n=1 Tax=Mesotoga prima TaxID=1184387 RepID=UPI002B590360|nr:type I glutamate--ammonia ligase [Mesotoga prima]HPA00291.1 type I glutamate--ammonia ligase [Mesotoga prima]HQN61643.1 type I glutamate--ammonia ligase [Mesotoga prima]HUM22899.1 type I glutamate--ammonia ligase [Mesotoga prima]